MVQINMTRDEKEAVNDIDRSQLQRLIDKCVQSDARSGRLNNYSADFWRESATAKAD
ncbi:hypothetical protein QA447_31280 [Pseudomonas sp. abacavir_1]